MESMLDKAIIEFAKEHKEARAVCVDSVEMPEEAGCEVANYYIITGMGFDREFATKVSLFELRLRKVHRCFNISTLQGYSNKDQAGRCIYDAKQKPDAQQQS